MLLWKHTYQKRCNKVQTVRPLFFYCWQKPPVAFTILHGWKFKLTVLFFKMIIYSRQCMECDEIESNFHKVFMLCRPFGDNSANSVSYVNALPSRLFPFFFYLCINPNLDQSWRCNRGQHHTVATCTQYHIFLFKILYKSLRLLMGLGI